MAVQAYASDLGIGLSSELYADSSAALGIAKRAGIGKVRHLRTQSLWIQEVRISGRIVYKKVLGEKNPSDLMTKYMTAELSAKHLQAINAEFVDGRAETAPGIGSFEKSDGETTLNDNDDIGELISWTRMIIDRGAQKVRFCEKVKVRPIPASGLGRSCRGTGRSSRRGRWPTRGVAILGEEMKGINDSERDGDGGAPAARSHDPRGGLAHTCGIGKVLVWSELGSDDEDEDVECAACRRACGNINAPMREAPIDCLESMPAEVRWSDELADDYEYESVADDAGIGRPGVQSDNFIFGSGDVRGGSSSYDAGVVDAGLGGAASEVAVIRPVGRTGKPSGCFIPIVSCAMVGNSCGVALLGCGCRLYDRFMRRRGSAWLHPPTNTYRHLHSDMSVRAHCHASARTGVMVSTRDRAQARCYQNSICTHTRCSRVFVPYTSPTSLAW
jgi:hypothetical protein